MHRHPLCHRRVESPLLWAGQAVSHTHWTPRFGGQIFITKAVQVEKAGPVAIMKTMDVVFAFIFQIAFFNNMPTWWTVGGALCVVASTTGSTIRRWIQSSK